MNISCTTHILNIKLYSNQKIKYIYANNKMEGGVHIWGSPYQSLCNFRHIKLKVKFE